MLAIRDKIIKYRDKIIKYIALNNSKQKRGKMKYRFSDRVSNLKPSAIREIFK